MALILRKLWNSPTFATWSSFGARSISLVVVMPLILHRFSTDEVALYYTYGTLWGILFTFDLGFSPTFIRAISYARSGRRSIDASAHQQQSLRNREDTTPESTRRILKETFSTMGAIYAGLGIAVPIVGLLLAAWLSSAPMAKEQPQIPVGLGYFAVLFNTSCVFFSLIFANYLQGMNQVAYLRRWESITQLVSVLVVIGGFSLGGSFISIVFLNYFSQGFLGLARNIVLYRWSKVRLNSRLQFRIYPAILSDLWPQTWRSGLGMVLGGGTLQGTLLTIAKFLPSKDSAPVLLAFRIVLVITEFSRAPLYSKLPHLTSLFAHANRNEFIRQAKCGMRLSFWAYVVPIIFFGAFAQPALSLLRSNTTFVAPDMWALLGLAFFLERYCAAHIQLYSLTNDILWHIVNGVTGMAFLALFVSLFGSMGTYALPISLIVGHLIFYCWFAPLHSLKMLEQRFWTFEKDVTVAPFAILLAYTLVRII